MKKSIELEVILFTKHSSRRLTSKEMIKWVGAKMQSAIIRQEQRSKKMLPGVLRGAPSIYLS